jgi:hypothetical protein
MNCEQMMEWMQRFVDQDLPQAELDILMSHIAQCPDCAASFEQLKQLSAELSSLPAVSPPFSIVDSILPKLAQIDAWQASTEGAYLPEKIHSKKSFFSWKMGVGFVAAAIIFGLIAVNLSPTSKNDASDMLSATTAAKRAEERAAQIPNSGAAQDNAITSATPTSATSSPEIPKATPAAPKEPKVRVTSAPSATTQMDKSTEVAQQKSIAPKQPKITSGTSKNLVKPEPTINAPLGNDVTNDAIKTYKIAPDIPSPTPAPVPNKDEKSKGSMYSITTTEESSPLSLASEDGNYIGYVEHQTVLVRTPDGSQIYTSTIQWNSADVIQLLKWEDDTHLSYEVTMEDGQLKRFVIDVILKTEQEQ